MADRFKALNATLIRSDFHIFVRFAFWKIHGESLGDQPYIELLCFVISKLIENETRRLLINLPPQHLKSFVGTICLTAYLLGKNPRLRVIMVTYSDTLAEALCDRIRDMMQTSWYREVFATRIKDGHSRADDFATTEHGGVFAAAATGAVTGRSADVIVYDDPHDISDWNNDRKLDLVKDNFNILLSRLSNRNRSRVIVIAHRISENDLSASLLQDKAWTRIRLPLVAHKRYEFDLGHATWMRRKGDILRPSAFSRNELDRLRTQVAPPFELFYQQGLGPRGSRRIRADDFLSFAPHEPPAATPIVLSVDPGYSGGPDASRSVIQAWSYDSRLHFLIDQFCAECDAEDLRKAFWFFARKYRPSAVLIEKTANGPALYAAIRRKSRFEINMVTPQAGKAERLRKHVGTIRDKKIALPEDALWREAFIDEVVNFPAAFDDQVDAMTQYLDFMATKPTLDVSEPRALGAIAFGSEFRRF